MAKHLEPGDAPVRTRRPVIAYVISALLIVVGLFTGTVAMTMIKQHSMNPIDSVANTFIFPQTPAALIGKDRVYVLLLGLDYDYDDKGMPYSKTSRSDTIKVAGIDFATKQVRLLSVLRDTAATVNGHETKINEAYGQGGVKLADTIIGDFLGLPVNERGQHFDRHITVRINAVKDFVGAIGGVDVVNTQQMDYDDNWANLHIHFKPGPIHLNGYDAQAYMRFRHDACSDPCRTKRQDQVMNALITKLKNDKLNDLAHIGQLMDIFKRDVVTDFTPDEEKAIAWAFHDAQNLSAKGETVPYVDTKETAYAGELLIPDERAKERMVATLTGPYVAPTPLPSGTVIAVDRSKVHLVVRNGSGVSGMGGKAGKDLEKLGYIVDSVENADKFDYETTEIRVAPKPEHLGDRLRSDLKIAGATIAPTVESTAAANAATVIVGRDYATAAAAATPAPAAAAAAVPTAAAK